MLVRKFHRHSSQNGATPSRGVRHCGQSSGARPPWPPGGGKPYPPPVGGGGGGTVPAMR